MNFALRYKAADPAVSTKATENAIGWMREYFRYRVNSRWIDERRCIPPHVVLDFGNEGLFGFNIEPQYGGLGLRAQDWGRLLAQAAALDPTVGALLFINSLTSRTFTSFAPHEMKADLLPKFSKGRILGAYAQTEPCAGSNFTAIETRAKKGLGGGWSLSGDKVWIGNAGWAAVFAVFAQTEDGMSAFSVPANASGLQVGVELNTLGFRGVVQNAVHLRDVKVGTANLLGELGGGIAVGVDAMTFTRLTIAAHQVGCMKRCVQLMYRYACRRSVSTGKLMANAVAINFVSECIARTVATEALLSQTLQRLDTGAAVSLEICALCKIVSTEYLGIVADKALQLLGGRGYEENNILPQIVRDARVTRIFEGPTELLASFVGTRIKGPRGPKCILELSRDQHAQQRIEERIGRIKEAVLVRQASRGFSAEQVDQWLSYRAGMYAAAAILTDTYRNSRDPSASIQEWLVACEDAYASGALSAPDCFLSSTAIGEFVAAFDREIGDDVEQMSPALNWRLDDMFRN